MKKLESTFRNMVLVLTIITLFAAGVLAVVYNATKEPIELAKIEKQQAAIKEVLPPYETLAEPEIITLEGIGDFTVYKAYDASNNPVGAAVESFSKNGFSGEVKIMVGFDESNKIVNYSVLEQKETPGLGTKMVDWFKTDKGNQNIVGKNAATDNLKVTRDGGTIDAITAATISSRAFLEAVQYAYAAFKNDPNAIDVSSGASWVDTNSGGTSTDSNSGATGMTDADSGATY